MNRKAREKEARVFGEPISGLDIGPKVRDALGLNPDMKIRGLCVDIRFNDVTRVVVTYSILGSEKQILAIADAVKDVGPTAILEHVTD